MPSKISGLWAVPLYAAACLLAASIFVPWWGMTFIAPQYPEGLKIIVYPYKMDGRIDIINGLNHYIGMKPFSEETFPELRFLPYLIGALAVLTLLVAVLRRRGPLYGLIVLLAVGGAVGLYDIHRWLKDFGTNLDPQAPIRIPPFVPPIYGTNKLANFVTHSTFSYGSAMLAAAFLLIVLPAAAALWKARRRS